MILIPVDTCTCYTAGSSETGPTPATLSELLKSTAKQTVKAETSSTKPCDKQVRLITNYFEGPRPLGPKEIDGLLVPPGKAYTLLTDHLIID